MSDRADFGTEVIHEGCGGELLVEVNLPSLGYQPRFYFECRECGEAGRWSPAGWS